MKRFLSLLLCVFLTLSLGAQEAEKVVKIACVGNSITYGSGIQNRFQDAYPGILQQYLGSGYDVRNFGVSARTMLWKGDYPYIGEQLYRDALAFEPDIVTIKLGTNDSKPHNWQYKADFEQNLTDLVLSFQKLASHPKVILLLPVPAVKDQWGINDKTILGEVIPKIKKVARKMGLETVDLHTALAPYPQLFPDNIHPNPQGSSLIAAEIYKALTGKTWTGGYDLTKPFPGVESQWNGQRRFDFIHQGRSATVVVPEKPAQGKPWIWRPAFFDAFASVDKALLEKGYHIVYFDLTHLYGSPRSVNLGNAFYETMTKVYGLSDKVVLEGFSRGGYFAFNWAAANPDKVSSIYVDAPVCDIQSWPSRNDKELWNDFLKEWGIQDKDVTDQFQGNALNQIGKIVSAGIPVMAVCGDSDQTVPYKDNMMKVQKAILDMGGICEVILKEGCDHHPHSLDDPEPVVDFILRYQKGYQDLQQVNPRDGIGNALAKFRNEKRGTVAFLGGSITQMNGWRNQIQDDLHQRFPDTKFTFIDAGIASLGSTPHAFRFEDDVLAKGTPDLMFLEAAVNDDTNGFSAESQVRAMEGIVRHALKANPSMDIVMLHFIWDPFVDLLKEGQMPDVILNHERVANRYQLPSINLAKEVSDRMVSGALTWEQFGGTHPSWEGHKFYTAAIHTLMDGQMALLNGHQIKVHQMPEALDPLNYENGHLLPLSQATRLKGFGLMEVWHPDPSRQASTRDGFVGVPMLVADKAGASFSLDFSGRAVGLYLVAGPSACVLEYRVDKGPWKSLDTYTEWSGSLYLPWLYMLEDELEMGPHRLTVRVAKTERTECQIYRFAVQ